MVHAGVLRKVAIWGIQPCKSTGVSAMPAQNMPWKQGKRGPGGGRSQKFAAVEILFAGHVSTIPPSRFVKSEAR